MEQKLNVQEDVKVVRLLITVHHVQIHISYQVENACLVKVIVKTVHNHVLFAKVALMVTI